MANFLGLSYAFQCGTDKDSVIDCLIVSKGLEKCSVDNSTVYCNVISMCIPSAERLYLRCNGIDSDVSGAYFLGGAFGQ